jgi:hypothetical protein
MDMPIQVVILLTVALAVGIGILAFSEDIFTKSKMQLNELGEEDENTDDKVMELGSVNIGKIKSLGEQCVKDFREEGKRELCFIVRSDSIPDLSSIDTETILDGDWGFERIDGETFSGKTSIFMYINPITGKIELER